MPMSTGGQAPVLVTFGESEVLLENPGELPAGLHVDGLIYCVPVYRNLSLADGARFFGLCDKIGKGIDIVYRSVISGGFDFPLFDSRDNHFTARLLLQRNEQFSEFVRRRSQSLSQLDEILTLRFLWSREQATVPELGVAMQRGCVLAQRIVESMAKKLMIEAVDDQHVAFRLAPVLRKDIENVFNSDQLALNLFG